MKNTTLFLENPEDYNRDFWQNISPQLLRHTENILPNDWNYAYSDSRTLQDVLRRTIHSYYRSSSLFKFLIKLCKIIPGTPNLKFIPQYLTISSTEAETYDYNKLCHEINANQNTEDVQITIVAIPRGKSYLKKILNDPQLDLKHITIFEQLYKQDYPNEYIEVIQDLTKTNPRNITIFSERPTEDLITLLILLLPNLLNLVSRETNEAYPELTEEDIDYNKKVAQLRTIFTVLFDSYQQNPTSYESLSRSLITAINNYAEMFDFIKTNQQNFLANLANARNNLATKYFKEQYQNAMRQIERLEQDLENYYIEKTKYERELIAHKQLNPDNIKPFIDTITQSKAIEILDSTENEMLLRVTAPLQYFTEADLESQESNSSSEYSYAIRNTPYLKEILHKVFVTREYKFINQAVIKLTITPSGYNNTPLDANIVRTGPDSLQDYTEFPNPHLWHHNCWSAAKKEIYKNITEGNFELAIMQMIAAVQSINLAENASFIRGLVYDLVNYPNRAALAHFIDNNGEIKTFNDLINYERQLKTETETANPINTEYELNAQHIDPLQVNIDATTIAQYIIQQAQQAQPVEPAARVYQQVELPDIAWEGEEEINETNNNNTGN